MYRFAKEKSLICTCWLRFVLFTVMRTRVVPAYTRFSFIKKRENEQKTWFQEVEFKIYKIIYIINVYSVFCYIPIYKSINVHRQNHPTWTPGQPPTLNRSHFKIISINNLIYPIGQGYPIMWFTTIIWRWLRWWLSRHIT